MKQLTTTLCLTVALLFGCAGVCKSGDYQKGWNAYEKGDYATALREWTPLVDQGDASAQFSLGGMYALGSGVLKDYVYAHMWGNLAASNGSENGGKLRDFVAKKMTSADISKAQDLARECIRKKYKGC